MISSLKWKDRNEDRRHETAFTAPGKHQLIGISGSIQHHTDTLILKNDVFFTSTVELKEEERLASGLTLEIYKQMKRQNPLTNKK